MNELKKQLSKHIMDNLHQADNPERELSEAYTVIQVLIEQLTLEQLTLLVESGDLEHCSQSLDNSNLQRLLNND